MFLKLVSSSLFKISLATRIPLAPASGVAYRRHGIGKERVAAEGGALKRRLDAAVIRQVHYWNRKGGSVWAGSLMILLQILTRNRLSDLKQGGT